MVTNAAQRVCWGIRFRAYALEACAQRFLAARKGAVFVDGAAAGLLSHSIRSGLFHTAPPPA